MITHFVPLEDVLVIHEMIIEATGGKRGVRDFALLHSAVSRPKATFGGEDLYKSIFDKAAALIHSLLLNHPFSDANKRTSLASGERFLYINGFNVVATQKQKVSFTLEIESKKLDFNGISLWLKNHAKKIR